MDRECGLLAFGKDANDQVLGMCRAGSVADGALWFDELVVEFPAPRNQLAGVDLFETMYWVGRFEEASDLEPFRIDRKDVKMAVCGSPRARDSDIRKALIERWGGEEAAIGKKADPGPLFGVAGDVWAALGVAVAWVVRVGHQKTARPAP